MDAAPGEFDDHENDFIYCNVCKSCSIYAVESILDVEFIGKEYIQKNIHMMPFFVVLMAMIDQ